MILFGSTWRGTVSSVHEYAERQAQVGLTLTDWRVDHGDPKECLPRAGEKYWLVSDTVFRRLTGDDG